MTGSDVTTPPAIFTSIVDSWRPQPVTAEQVVTDWPATALAALLGAEVPGVGEALPLMWHEAYLRPTLAVGDLGKDGHPAFAPLVPAIEDRRRMFGGGRMVLRSPIRIGDRVERTSAITSVAAREGRSGWLLQVTERHEFSVAGDLRVTDERDIFYRLPSDVAGSAPAPGTRSTEGSSLTVLPEERMLFLFSALSYNAHRIHYDREYATAVEGHPGLVVHGPLIALLGLEVARRTLGADITAAEYRLLSPAYGGRPLDFVVEDRDTETTTIVGIQEGRQCLSLSASSANQETK